MPAKKSTKSRVAKKGIGKKRGFFRWWMGVGIVALIAIIGIIVLRQSQAQATYVRVYQAYVNGEDTSASRGTTRLYLGGAGIWDRIGRYSAGSVKWHNNNTGRCATIVPANAPSLGIAWLNGSSTVIYAQQNVTIGETNNCD